MIRATILALTMLAANALFANAAAAPRQIAVLHGKETNCRVSVEFEQGGRWLSHASTQARCVVEYDMVGAGDIRIAFEVTPSYGPQIDVTALVLQFEIPAEERRLLRPFSIQVPPRLTGDRIDLTIERYWQNLNGPARANLGDASEVWEQVLWAHMALSGQRADGGPIVVTGNSALDCSSGGQLRRGRYECLEAIIERGCHLLSSTPPTRLAVAHARWNQGMDICGALSSEEAIAFIHAEIRSRSKLPISMPPPDSDKL